MPLGSPIVSDIIYCPHQDKPRYIKFDRELIDIKLVTDFKSTHYMVLIARGTNPEFWARTAAVLGNNQVSIDSVIQKANIKSSQGLCS